MAAQNHLLQLPEIEPWPEPINGELLLDELLAIINRFVVLPKLAGETLALWTLHTYAFHLRDVSTYLGIESPEKRCGKTTLLTVLSELVNRPIVSSNISSPAFFRVIEETLPTLLIDEADTFLQANDELRGILNSGYTRKTAFVVRVAQSSAAPSTTLERSTLHAPGSPLPATTSTLEAPRSSALRLVRFSCWCPKVIAAIGRLPETLADRSIVIRMQRKTNKEQCERLRNLETTNLKRYCARFVLDHTAEIAGARPQLPASLNDRAADIWEPLLVLADLAAGHWPATARQAAVSLTEAAHESNPIGSLLFDICVAFILSKSDRLFSRNIIEELNHLPDRPWRLTTKSKGIDESWLSRQLRPYGVQPRTFRISGVQAKGYLREDFRETFCRYIPKSEIDALRAESQPAVPPPDH